MLIVKKLLSPIFTGVLVAFFFIAVETAFLPKSISTPEAPQIKTTVDPISLENEDSQKAIQNYQELSLSKDDQTQKSDESTNTIPKSKIKIQNDNKTTRSISSALQYSNTIKNSKLKIQNSKRQNRLTDNVNVLFIGVDKGKLLACSVFTINYQDKYQAGAVFVPTYSKAPKYKYTFGEIYEKVGVEGLRRVLEKEMEVDISLYYSIERELLKQLETYIDPIYIDDRKVELYNLFTMAVSPQDEQILGALTRELLKPGVFFTKLPRLLLDATKYIKRDFKVTFQNLKFHYNNIVNLDTHNIKKVVLPVSQKMSGSKTYYEVDEYALKNGIYEISR